MHQNNDEQLQLLYYIHTEILQAEQVDKILWNENFKEWKTLINQEYNVKILGLYGAQETVSEYLSKRLQSTITLSDEAKQYQNRAMICFVKNKNCFYFAFIGLEDYFKKDYFQESIEVSLFRYLKDLCSQIILLPSLSILDGWKGLDMVTNSENTSILKEYSIKETVDDSLQFQRIELKVDKKTTEFVEKFQFAQSNNRVIYNKKKNFLFIDDSKLKDIFQQLMLDIEYEKLNLSDCSVEVKEILQKIVSNILEQIQKKRTKKFNKSESLLCLDFQQDIFLFSWGKIRVDQRFSFFEQYQEQLIKLVQEKEKDKLTQIKKDQFKQLLIRQIELLQPSRKEKQNNKLNVIQDIYLNFSQQVKTKIDQINQISDYLMEIQLYQFSIVRDQQQNQFSIIKPIQKQEYSIKQDLSIQNPESLQLIYYFSTQKTKQNMSILQFKSSVDGSYQYKWVAFQYDNQIKTIFTYREKASNLIFYYDESTQYLYSFNCQKRVNKTKLNENNNKIESDESHPIEQKEEFKEICYLSHHQCFLLIDNKNELYKWIDQNLEPLKLQEQNDQSYVKVFTVGSGHYYCLANLRQVDLFNFNNSKIKSINFYKDYGIQISDKRQINLFHDQWNWYLCLMNTENQVVIKIKNANSQQQIVEENKVEIKKKYSNPFLEIIKSSVNIFGPPLQFIPTSRTVTQLIVDKEKYNLINQYFEFLSIRSSDELMKKKDIFQIDGIQVKINDLIFVMITRVALQLCTIDQSILVPLIAGQYKKELEVQNLDKKFDILEKIDCIIFGIFENLQIEQYQIFIVSIIGKQSHGKSYLMNRLFGTRFSVSQARCTDGIQMSLSKINDTIFIILDCEGLFSQIRSVVEEQKLLNILFGLSDVTILNQDLAFSRNINDLFTNFTNGNIQGDNLYNGKLLITVRDVNKNQQVQVENELIQNIGSIQTCGLFKSFTTVFMSHFENKQFDDDVREIRNRLFNYSIGQRKWSNFKQVLQTMKIMLVQLQVNDNRKIEEIIQEYNKKKIKNSAIMLWSRYQENDLEGLNFKNQDITFSLLYKFFLNNYQIYQKANHNQVLQEVGNKIKYYLEQRMMKVINQLEKLNQSDQEIFNQTKEYFSNYVKQYEICDQKCSYCNLNCNQRIKHSQLNQHELETINTKLGELQDSIILLQKRIEQSNVFTEEQQESLLTQLKLLYDEKQILTLLQEKSQVEEKLKILFDKQIQTQIYSQIDWQSQLDCKQISSKGKLLTQNDLVIYENNMLKQQGKLQYEKNQYEFKLAQIQKQKEAQLTREQLNKKIFDQKQEIKNINTELTQLNYQCNSKDNLIIYSPKQLEELQINLENRQNEKQNLVDQSDQIEKEFQQLKQQFLENQLQEPSSLNNLIEYDYMPLLEKEIFNLKSDFNRDSKKLQMKNEQLNQQAITTLIQGNSEKINQDIKILKRNIQDNQQKQVIFNNYYVILNQFVQEGSQNQEEIIDIIIQLEKKDLLLKRIMFQDQINLINVGIDSLKIQQKQYDLQKMLSSIEQVVKQYQEQIDQINKIDEEQNNELEPSSQNPLYFQDKITFIKDEIQKLLLQMIQNQENLQIFQQIIGLQDQLLNLNNQIQENRLIQLTGQELQEIEQQIIVINQKLSQYKELKILNFQLRQVEEDQMPYQKRYTQIKNDINTSHNCGFISHQCDQQCQVCQENNVLCKFKAGHKEKFHLCMNQQHFCGFKCKMETCDKTCQQEYGHDESLFHNCLNHHQCESRCNFCKDYCFKNAIFQHDHQCQRVICDQVCYFGKNGFNNKCENSCSKLHSDVHEQHICENKHQCQEYCGSNGICSIGTYTEKQVKRQTLNGSFHFTFYEQNAEKIQCIEQIEKGNFVHQGQHLCGKQHHTCTHRCPECNAFCEKKYGHSGQHTVNQHRNKEKQQFSLLEENSQGGQSKIVIYLEQSKDQRIYNVGENCQPETCTSSCSRRGRGHFHLIHCQSLQTCLEKRINKDDHVYVKHQPKPYYGSLLIYDEVLCNKYWEIQNWQHPVNKKDGQLIQFCNYYCKKCENDFKERNFCTLKAWHNDSQNYVDHQLSCAEDHKFNGIDIAFVIDSTESMQKYVGMIQQSIQKFQNASDKFKQNEINPILYSIVSYTDHDLDYRVNRKGCVKFEDFTNFQEVLEFSRNINFEKSSDYCEAMLDGLNKAEQLKWRPKSQKFIFLLADAPPHGINKFHNYSYTFFFDRNDNFPEGCPCGLKEDVLLPKLFRKQIKLVILKLNEELNMTINVFKKYVNLQELRSNDLQQEDFIKQMEKLICDQLNSNEITLTV